MVAGAQFRARGQQRQRVLAEHNVIRDGSWPLQSFGGEFRYNLMINSGHDFGRSSMNNASFHHNIFTHQTIPDTSFNGAFLFYLGEQNVSFYNNTFDGGGSMVVFSAAVMNLDTGVMLSSYRNNAINRFLGHWNRFHERVHLVGEYGADIDARRVRRLQRVGKSAGDQYGPVRSRGGRGRRGSPR